MGFVAQATAMDSIGPFLFIALRFIVATLVVLPFVLRESRMQTRQGDASLSWHDVAGFTLVGISLFAGMATQQVGLLTTTVTNSGFLTGLYVVLTPMLGIVLFRDVPHRVTWLAAMLALSGIYLLSGGDITELVIGDVLTMLSALCWALQVVMIARFVGRSGRPLALSAVQFAVTAALALIVALAIEPIIWTSIQAAGLQILYTGIFASGLAFTLQVIGQRYTSAPQAAIFLSAEAPFAALFAFIWLDERIGLVGLAGCALILIAMLVVELVPEWLQLRAAGRKPVRQSTMS